MIPSQGWFLNLPKIVNNNGCWISNYAIRRDGYVRIRYNSSIMLLHRASMCAFYNIEYNDYKIDTRHNNGCIRACFNPEHLKPGSHYDNIQDAKNSGSYEKDRGVICPKCGRKYTTVTNKNGASKGKSQQYCKHCQNERRRKKYHDSK